MRLLAALLLVMALFVAGCSEPVTNEEDLDLNEEVVNDDDEKVNNDSDEKPTEEDVTSDGENNENKKDNEKEEIKDEENANQDEKDTNEDKETKPLTEEDAKTKIKEYLGIVHDEEVSIVVDREENGKYIIQVFDVVQGENGVGHTLTRGWYSVDRKTGEVKELL